MPKRNESEFRNADEYNAKYIQPIMDKIYNLLGFVIKERVEDQERQVRGADIILEAVSIGNGNGNMTITMDEKLDAKRRLNSDFFHFKEDFDHQDKASTFCQELHMLNQAKQWQNGWFHPDIRTLALNQYYVYIWINGRKDTAFENKKGKLQQVTEIEVAIVKHEDLVHRLEKDPKFKYTPEAINAIINKVKGHIIDWDKDQRFKDAEFAYQEAYPYYSGYLTEKPINLIVYKKVLRDISVCAYAFKLKGENGEEELVSFRRTKPLMSNNGKKQEQFNFSNIKHFTPEIVFN